MSNNYHITRRTTAHKNIDKANQAQKEFARCQKKLSYAAPLHAVPELLAATEKEKEKIRKYEAVMRSSGDDFVPVILETYGTIGRKARKLLAEIAEQSPHHQRKDFREWAYLYLSCALQKGNAAIWQGGAKLVPIIL